MNFLPMWLMISQSMYLPHIIPFDINMNENHTAYTLPNFSFKKLHQLMGHHQPRSTTLVKNPPILSI